VGESTCTQANHPPIPGILPKWVNQLFFIILWPIEVAWLRLLLLQELVEDVSVATSSSHADLSWARRFAVASPRFIGRNVYILCWSLLLFVLTLNEWCEILIQNTRKVLVLQ